MERIRKAIKILNKNYDIVRNIYTFESYEPLAEIQHLLESYLSDRGLEPLLRIDAFEDNVRVYDNGKELSDVAGVRFNANVDCPPVVTITKFIGRGEE